MDIITLLEHERNLSSNTAMDTTLNDYTLFARKHLQLHIKMGELANETKCYKYWVGDIDTIDSKNVFDKYISCFRQILFLGLDCNFEDTSLVEPQSADSCLSDQFLNLYIDINDCIMSSCTDNFFTLIEDYLTLGASLGFSQNRIFDALSNDTALEMAL